MTDNTEALLKELEKMVAGAWATDSEAKALVELRRLHALNAELVEALTEVLEFQSAKEGPSIYDWGRWRKVRDRAALAKVEASK